MTTNFKISKDDITAGVRTNDALTDVCQDEDDPIGSLARSLGVDGEALTYVSMERSILLAQSTPRKLTLDPRSALMGEILQLASISSGWLDGFFTALHVIEQKISSGSLTSVE